MNQFITFCAIVMVGPQIIFVVNFFYSIFFGPKVGRNPWHANTPRMDRAEPAGPRQLRFPTDRLSRAVRVRLAGSRYRLLSADSAPAGGCEASTGRPLILGSPFAMNIADQTVRSPWPHRWAVVLACATFPLVWVGGLVTTTDAGMAVPDWPSTYGYNLFLYPWQSWLAGPWDLFVEHGHRLLASGVGILTIGLVIVVWRTHERRWLRNLSLAAFALVIFQGVLGGMRVLMDERTLAMLHGCTRPAVLRALRGDGHFHVEELGRGRGSSNKSEPASNLVRWLAVATCILVYLQLVFGAVLRHCAGRRRAGGVSARGAFPFVHGRRAGAACAAVGLVGDSAFLRRAAALAGWYWRSCGLFLVQLLLGAATWIVKFGGRPGPASWMAARWLHDSSRWLVRKRIIITAHVAVGSLLLATAVAIALTALRSLSAHCNFAAAQLEGRIGVAT